MQDSVLFRYLAVTTHIQITMGKSTHFIGQYRESDTDGDAEAAGAEMELLGTGHNGQNSAVYYVDFYSLFNNPEKDWENMAVFDKISPHQLTLF